MNGTTTGRDGNGRFAPGWTGGPGRPRREVEQQYQLAFHNALRPEDLAGVVQAMVAKALEGNVQAARLLFDYGIGRPTVRLELAREPAFCVAGRSPGEVDREMLEYVAEKIRSRAEYEKSLQLSDQTP